MAIALGAVLVATGIVVALVIHFSGGGGGGGKPQPYDAATEHPTSSPSASPTRSPAPTVPAGYHKVTAQDGSTLVVPKGWEHKVNSPQSEKWQDPRTGSHVQVDTIPWETVDPLKHWQIFGARAPANLPGFQWVERPHYVTVHGVRGANGEYTWSYGKYGKVYAFDSGFTVNGTQYSLMAADRDGGVAADRFDKVLAAFHPSGR